jgi:hypothetical protein
MRRTVRPFVKEFKTRWSKSPKPQSQEAAESDRTTRFAQSMLDHDPGHNPQAREDENYLAALKAADAAFGALQPIASKAPATSETSATGGSHVGRILPSLVEEKPSAEPDLRATSASEPTPKAAPVRRTRKNGQDGAPSLKVAPSPAKAPIAKSVKLTSPRTKPLSPPTARRLKVAPDKATDKPALEAETSVAAKGAERSIQRRWVSKTAFKAGEKWKRRLRKPGL